MVDPFAGLRIAEADPHQRSAFLVGHEAQRVVSRCASGHFDHVGAGQERSFSCVAFKKAALHMEGLRSAEPVLKRQGHNQRLLGGVGVGMLRRDRLRRSGHAFQSVQLRGPIGQCEEQGAAVAFRSFMSRICSCTCGIGAFRSLSFPISPGVLLGSGHRQRSEGNGEVDGALGWHGHVLVAAPVGRLKQWLEIPRLVGGIGERDVERLLFPHSRIEAQRLDFLLWLRLAATGARQQKHPFAASTAGLLAGVLCLLGFRHAGRDAQFHALRPNVRVDLLRLEGDAEHQLRVGVHVTRERLDAEVLRERALVPLERHRKVSAVVEQQLLRNLGALRYDSKCESVAQERNVHAKGLSAQVHHPLLDAVLGQREQLLREGRDALVGREGDHHVQGLSRLERGLAGGDADSVSAVRRLGQVLVEAQREAHDPRRSIHDGELLPAPRADGDLPQVHGHLSRIHQLQPRRHADAVDRDGNS
eukprot:scaffold8063_cov277-Pinguiococcus_pyrenoidosus.AAC.3